MKWKGFSPFIKQAPCNLKCNYKISYLLWIYLRIGFLVRELLFNEVCVVNCSTLFFSYLQDGTPAKSKATLS